MYEVCEKIYGKTGDNAKQWREINSFSPRNMTAVKIAYDDHADQKKW